MKSQRISVGVYKEYETFGFPIAPGLAGATHQFRHHGLEVSIKLPNRPKVQDWDTHDARITCSSWVNEPRRRPLQFEIHNIRISAKTSQTRSVRADALGRVDHSKFTQHQRNSLDRFCSRHEEVLDSAFDYWIGVLRWVLQDPTFVRQSETRNEALSRSYLVANVTGRIFYSPTLQFMVVRENVVLRRHWKRAGVKLLNQANIPIWRITFAEAHERYHLDDSRGFVLGLAMSVETMVRKLTRVFLSSPPNERYAALVDNVPISRIIGKWRQLGFTNPGWVKIEKEKKLILKLFEVRNGVIHRGEKPDLTKKELQAFSNAVAAFLNQGEKYA